jgi:hypothetical protein
MGHVLFYMSPTPRAVSLLTGRKLWEQDMPELELRRGQARLGAGNGMIVLAANLKSAGYILCGLDAMTGKIHWKRSMAQVRRPHIQTYGRYVLDYSYGLHGSVPQKVKIYDARSGELLNPAFPRPAGHHFWTEDGIICRDGTGYVLRRLPDGKTLWKLPHNAQNQTFVRPVQNSNFGMLVEKNKYSFLDPKAKKIRWSIKHETDNARSHMVPIYDRYRDDILLLNRVRKDNQWSYDLLVVDVRTGEKQHELSLEKGMRLQYRSRVPLNDRHLLAMKYVREKKNNHTRITSKRYRLVRLKDGKVVPDLRLPRSADLAKNERRYHFQVQLVGDTIVFSAGAKVLIYGGTGDRDAK